VDVVLEQAFPAAVARHLIRALGVPAKADMAQRIAELGSHDD
jgi:hypothetical protein